MADFRLANRRLRFVLTAWPCIPVLLASRADTSECTSGLKCDLLREPFELLVKQVAK